MFQRKTVIIDAQKKKLGRISSEAVKALRGKDLPSYAPYKDEGAVVHIINAEKLDLIKDKRKKKFYWRHSGHLGGIKFTSADYLWDKNPHEVIRRAVYGMLPSNRLRANMMRRLKIFSGDKK